MSANMFTQTPTTNLQRAAESKTRIPIPASPTPLRRQGSLRTKGDSDATRRLSCGGSPAASKDNCRPGRFSGKYTQSAANPPLKRGYSFMERGEQRVGNGGSGSTVPRRPDTVKIDPRHLGTLKGPTTPQSPSRIRSLSLSLSNTRLQSSPKSPSAVTISPNNSIDHEARNYSTTHLDYWDSESVTSIDSSVASCEHASVARNGTTFSGRSMKYVFHCNQHAGATGEDYLTPTQRAHRQVKKLKYFLQQAKKDLEQKDSDILKLTKEVVELRLYKAALSSPEDKSNSSDAVTVRENASEDVTPVEACVTNHILNEMSISCADSGHFEDCTNSSVHSKDSVLFDDHRSPYKSKSVETCDKCIAADLNIEYESERAKLIMEYEKRLQELVRTHEDESYQMKQKHNDKVEELLQRITEINTRYWQLVPELEIARERIKELEQQLEEASEKLEEQEQKGKEPNKALTMKQSAGTVDECVVVELAHQNPTRVSVPELLQELQVTKNELENIKAMYRQLMEAKSKNKIDPEITLQFLKSAIYYFLTDKENSQGHLKAIQSILGFSTNEISNIDKARFT